MDFAEAKVFSDKLLESGPVAGWELVSYLSHGKSAVVLKAQKDERCAAIKIFHPGLIERYGLDAQLIRVGRERELIERNHENMVRILDAGRCEETGQIFVAMEFAPGKPLSKVLNEIPRENIRRLIDQLARAGMQLENWGFTHRDIKPDNIHVDECTKNLILLDFGVLKPHADESATLMQVSKAFIGTHQYSPPEMIHGREENTLYGWRAITFYQIGAVLHDLIVRKPLFDYATNRHADLVNAINNDVVVVQEKDVSPDLCNLATRCLLKNHQERLELVSWQDFMVSSHASEGPSISERKEALRRQFQLGRILNKSNAIEILEDSRAKERRLSKVVQSVRSCFDGVLAELGDLMPARCTKLDGGAYPSPSVTYSFSVPRNSLIKTALRIQIAVAVADERTIVDVYARASKGASDTEVGWTHLGAALEDLEGFSNSFQDWLLAIIEELLSQ